MGYVHHEWTVEHGLPQNIVSNLLASRDGYLWIGASSGIVRFDGLTFSTFDVTNTPVLESNRIGAFHESVDGTLWIGHSRGMVRYRAGVFTREEGEGRFSDELIRVICDGPDDRLLAASVEHVYRRERGGRWRLLPVKDIADGVTTIVVDRRGAVWIASGRRLIEWREGSVRTFTVRDGLPDAPITALREGRDGRIWIGTSRGLAHLDPDAGVVTVEPGQLAQVHVVRLLIDRDNVLWIGALNQLVTRAADGRVAVHPVAGLGEDAPVSALAQDAGGQIWFGLGGGAGGLHRLTRRRVTTYTVKDGLPCDNIGPVAEAADGTIWLGTLCSDGSGLVALKDGQVRTYVNEPGAPRYVSALLPLPDGELLIATLSTGLVRLKDGRFTPVASPSQSALTHINVLHRDDAGTLWVGTTDGLSRYQHGEWRTWRTSDGLPSHDVRTIVADRDGSLWIGTGAGVTHFENGRLVSFGHAQAVPLGEVRALHVDHDGVLWIGTYGGGLARLKSGRVTAYGTFDGLLDVSVHRIIEDDRGDLWLTGDRGIRRVSRAELTTIAEGRRARPSVEIFDTTDGMRNAECNGMGQPAGTRTRAGSLWIPSQGGLVRLEPSVVRAVAPAPPMTIDAVLVNGVEQPAAQALTIPPGGHDLEIRYTAPVLMRPEQVYFRYRLLGNGDDEWVDAGRRRIAHFAGLGPGDYQFQVTARNSAGAWSDTGAALRLVLQPRWDERLAFKAALAGVLLLALGLAVRMRLQQLRHRARRLEAVVEARTMELRVKQEGLQHALHELRAAKTELEGNHTRLLATFNQLRVGVIIVDAEMRVRFLSDATRRLIDGEGLDALGQPLERVLPIGPDAMTSIRAQIRMPQPGVRVTTELAPASGQRYWAEVEVQPDPGAPGQRVLYLYDVTETFDLKRVLNAGSREIGADLLGESVAISALRGEIATVAGLDVTVLIEGETGTGKELVARAIHDASRRKHRPFVAINCAGLSESLLASQLFGHRRGAFTGAVSDQPGLFEAADGGTLLLDEIGDMPLGVQTQLLRVLQEREILRLGDAKPRAIDVRLLAATHRDLDADVASGRFREDLLYRIRVVRVRLPPLRLRGGDIARLAAAFLRRACEVHTLQVESISREAMEHLEAHRWPGNVRELKATIEGAAIRATGPVLKLSDILPELPAAHVPSARRTLREGERRLLLDALRQSGGNRKAAARLLGMGRSTLYRRLAMLEAEGTVLPSDTSAPTSSSDN